MKAWISATTIGTWASALALATPAAADDVASAAVEQASVALPPGAYIWDENATPEGSVTVIVSIPDQRAYVYRGMALVAASTVSTGKKGKGTPLGNYTVLQKRVDHKSSLYNAAPMPFMQRLTWGGIAIHAGRNPGFPASHGCIRVPAAFARKLFAATTLGTAVTVTGEASYYVEPAVLVPDDLGAVPHVEVAVN